MSITQRLIKTKDPAEAMRLKGLPKDTEERRALFTALRQALGPQWAVGEALGMSQQWISQIERGTGTAEREVKASWVWMLVGLAAREQVAGKLSAGREERAVPT